MEMDGAKMRIGDSTWLDGADGTVPYTWVLHVNAENARNLILSPITTTHTEPQNMGEKRNSAFASKSQQINFTNGWHMNDGKDGTSSIFYPMPLLIPCGIAPSTQQPTNIIIVRRSILRIEFTIRVNISFTVYFTTTFP